MCRAHIYFPSFRPACVSVASVVLDATCIAQLWILIRALAPLRGACKKMLLGLS